MTTWYGYYIDNKATKPQNQHYCRELLQKELTRHLKRDMLMPLLGVVSFKIQLDGVTIKDKDKVAKGIVALITRFTSGLLKDIPIRGKKVIKITADTTARSYMYGSVISVYSSLPAAVLHNPLFASFYLGAVKALVNAYCKKALVRKVAYKSLLEANCGDSSSPLRRDMGDRMDALLLPYKDKEFPSKILMGKSSSIYREEYNGFNNYYDMYGRQYVRDIKLKKARMAKLKKVLR